MEERGNGVDRRSFVSGAAGIAGAVGFAALGIGSTQAHAEESVARSSVSTTSSSASSMEGSSIGSSAVTSVSSDFGQPVKTLSCDIVVVGTGMAGLSAANEALDAGADVIVIEKTGAVGGQSQSAEVMFGSGSSMQKDMGLTYTDYELLTNECAFHNWHVDRELWSRIVAFSGESIDWLIGKVEPYGGGFSAVLGDQEKGICVAHMYKPVDLDGVSYAKGAGQLAILQKLLLDAGVQIITKCEGKQLIMNDDKVSGIYAQSEDGLIEIDCGAVILACGGFTGSTQMIDELGRNSSRMMVRGYGTNVGDGIRMAREVGADHRGAMCVQLMGPSMPFPDGNSHRYVNSAACLLGYPLWVNQDGIRFVPESGLIYTVTANAIDMQNDVFSIFDATQLAAYNSFVVPEGMNTYFEPGTILDQTEAEIEELLADGEDYAFKADSITELADAMGVPSDVLQATVDEYNAVVDAGEDTDFGKDPSLLVHVSTPPFYGFKVYSNLLCTVGGVRINSDAQVLKPGSVPIPGLYCAGCDCDGFTGETYGVNLPGSTQGIALCTGRLAARHASAYVKA